MSKCVPVGVGNDSRFEHSFIAEVKLDGVNPYVDVPDEVFRLLGDGSAASVLVRLVRVGCGDGETPAPRKPENVRDAGRLRAICRLTEDGEFRSTILARLHAPSRLFLDTWMRDAADVEVGNCVAVALEPDRGSRELPLPELLRDALEQDAGANTAWNSLAPSRRREILSYLNFLKTPAALEKNVKRTLESLTG